MLLNIDSTKNISTLTDAWKGLNPISNTRQFQLYCKLNFPLYTKLEPQSQPFPLSKVDLVIESLQR